MRFGNLNCYELRHLCFNNNNKSRRKQNLCNFIIFLILERFYKFLVILRLYKRDCEKKSKIENSTPFEIFPLNYVWYVFDSII